MILLLLLIGSALSLGLQVTEFELVDPRASYKAWLGLYSKDNNLLTAQTIDPARYKLFKRSLEFVKHGLEKETSFTMELNKFADMTYAERESYTGLNMTGIESVSPSLQSTPTLRAPSEVDYRYGLGMTTVRDQKGCGSCWAFASVAVLESRYKKQTDELLLLSEQELVDCAYSDGKFSIQNKDGCKGGFMSVAFEYVKHKGRLASRLDYEYKADSSWCKANNYQSVLTRARVDSWRQLPKGDNYLIQEVGSAGPVSVAVYSTRSLTFYSSGLYSGTGCSGQSVNHAVVVVGYKPDRWIVRNSWGVGWGNNGYAYFSRSIVGICGISDFIVTVNMMHHPPAGNNEASKVSEHHRQRCVDSSSWAIDEWQCGKQGCWWDGNGKTKCFVKSKVTLYSEAYYQGTSITFYGNVPDLYEYDFTKLTKSIIVHEGVWLFYQKENYGEKGGWSLGTLGPGDYANLAVSGTDAAITSLRPLPSGDIITIFKHDNGRGEAYSIHEEEFNLDKSWNDEASSAYSPRKWEMCKHGNFKSCSAVDPGLSTSLKCNDCLSSARIIWN